MRIAGAVLGAGGSKRLGRPKQLLELDGESLVRRAVRIVGGSGAAPVGLVVGARAEEIVAAVHGLDVTLLRNPSWEEGIASSIRVAAAWAESLHCDGLLLALCDQPQLSSIHVEALIAAFAFERKNVGSAYAGIVGAPAVFARAVFGKLGELRGDRGAAELLRVDAASVEWGDGSIDIDSERDVEAHLTIDRTRRDGDRDGPLEKANGRTNLLDATRQPGEGRQS